MLLFLLSLEQNKECKDSSFPALDLPLTSHEEEAVGDQTLPQQEAP